MSIASDSDLSDVRDDVFMGYNEEDVKPNSLRFKKEPDEMCNDIDQVVPTRCENVVINDDNNSLDVIILYVD
jgi:hypothetical protein